MLWLGKLRRKTGSTLARLSLPLIVALVAAPASAIVIDNGISVIDTSTNLEWLDLTQTQGLSWNQAEASTFVTVDGYVHATDEQVITLFGNAGFGALTNTSNLLNDPAGALLLGALGCTQFCGTVNALGRGFADWNGAQITRPFYRASPLGAAAATTSGLTADFDLVDTTAGHYLVRVVPEPAASTLFGAGLLLLGIHRRRGRSSRASASERGLR
jgi:hypothetical protein